MNKKEILEKNKKTVAKAPPLKAEEPVLDETVGGGEPVVSEDETPKKLDGLKLTRRSKSEAPKFPAKLPPAITAGAIDKVTDLMFNPSREKIREVTIIDRMQGKLLPQMDLINSIFHYVVEVATFRLDSDVYATLYEQERPIPPDVLDDFSYRTAQWQKSVGGTNLSKGIEVVLAETETRAQDDPYNIRPDSSE